MVYTVNLTSRAERDLANLYEQIDAEHSKTARKWYLGLKKEILTLGILPFRCPVTRENTNLRHLLYGHGHNTYRVIYRVIGRQVDVLHIRHGARESSGERELLSLLNAESAGCSAVGHLLAVRIQKPQRALPERPRPLSSRISRRSLNQPLG